MLFLIKNTQLLKATLYLFKKQAKCVVIIQN